MSDFLKALPIILSAISFLGTVCFTGYFLYWRLWAAKSVAEPIKTLTEDGASNKAKISSFSADLDDMKRQHLQTRFDLVQTFNNDLSALQKLIQTELNNLWHAKVETVEMDAQLGAVQTKLDRIDDRFQAQESKFDRADDKLHKLSTSVEANYHEVMSHFLKGKGS